MCRFSYKPGCSFGRRLFGYFLRLFSTFFLPVSRPIFIFHPSFSPWQRSAFIPYLLRFYRPPQLPYFNPRPSPLRTPIHSTPWPSTLHSRFANFPPPPVPLAPCLPLLFCFCFFALPLFFAVHTSVGNRILIGFGLPSLGQKSKPPPLSGSLTVLFPVVALLVFPRMGLGLQMMTCGDYGGCCALAVREGLFEKVVRE